MKTIKILLALILFTIVFCKIQQAFKQKDPPVHLVRAFKNAGNWDSVYLYSDGHLVIIENPDLPCFGRGCDPKIITLYPNKSFNSNIKKTNVK